jgi:hypothetical protein
MVYSARHGIFLSVYHLFRFLETIEVRLSQINRLIGICANQTPLFEELLGSPINDVHHKNIQGLNEYKLVIECRKVLGN